MVPPAGFVGDLSYRLDSSSSFLAPHVATFVPASNGWNVGSPAQFIHTDQLHQAALGIEKLWQQDYAAGGEFDDFDVDPVLAPDGVTILVPGFKIKLDQIGDLPANFHVGSWSNPLGVAGGVAFAFVKMVREKLGIGPAYVPPSP